MKIFISIDLILDQNRKRKQQVYMTKKLVIRSLKLKIGEDGLK